jgi:hypothetical protein
MQHMPDARAIAAGAFGQSSASAGPEACGLILS